MNYYKRIKVTAEFVFLLIFIVLSFVAWRWSISSRTKLTETKKNYDERNPADRRWDEGLKKKLDDATVVYDVSRWAKFGLLSIAGLMLVLSCVWFVPVRNVGIVTSFNAPTGRTTGAGLKVTWPWEEVVDFDASVQVSDHTGNEKCTTVRIGSLATACVENRIQWQVLESAAPKLYRDYKGSFENLKNNLVETRIQNALNAVFATYNPLSQVNIQTGQTAFDGKLLASSVEKELNETIGADIKILTVSVPLVHHDSRTEDNIKQFQDVIAQGRILEQKNKNADLEKAVADKQRAFLTPEYIQNKCIEESVKMGVSPGYCLMNGSIVNAAGK